MAKSDVTQEQARALVDKVAQELGLLVSDTSGFIKVQGPTNKHRIYIQKSRTLNRIDTTLMLAADDPAFKPLAAPNGGVQSHIQPDLEQLERTLRMLGDANLGTQVSNKPRPFAATKAPAARRPKPVVAPVEVKIEAVPEGGSLKERLAKIKASARKARISRILENPQQYGNLTEAEAIAIVDGKVEQDDATEAAANKAASELSQIVEESGIEIEAFS